MAETWRAQFRALFAGAFNRSGVELHRFVIDVYNAAWSEIAPGLHLTDHSLRSAAEQRALTAEAALSATRASSSWRVTVPLRALAVALRR
jgi:hypothetical protein